MAEVTSCVRASNDMPEKIDKDINAKDTPALKSNLPPLEIECKGKYCSRYGLSFGTCIINQFPVEKLVIDDVMRECHFVDGRDSESLSNHEKSSVYIIGIAQIFIQSAAKITALNFQSV